MTKEEQLFLLAFRTAEAIYRKPNQPVKSQAEIMAEFPFKWQQRIVIDPMELEKITPELAELMKYRIEELTTPTQEQVTEAFLNKIEESR